MGRTLISAWWSVLVFGFFLSGARGDRTFIVKVESAAKSGGRRSIPPPSATRVAQVKNLALVIGEAVDEITPHLRKEGRRDPRYSLTIKSPNEPAGGRSLQFSVVEGWTLFSFLREIIQGNNPAQSFPTVFLDTLGDYTFTGPLSGRNHQISDIAELMLAAETTRPQWLGDRITALVSHLKSKDYDLIAQEMSGLHWLCEIYLEKVGLSAPVLDSTLEAKGRLVEEAPLLAKQIARTPQERRRDNGMFLLTQSQPREIRDLMIHHLLGMPLNPDQRTQLNEEVSTRHLFTELFHPLPKQAEVSCAIPLASKSTS